MKRLIALLVAFVTLLGIGIATAGSAQAAGKKADTTITVQVDPDVPSIWPRSAPSMWGKGTPLNFVYGPCSGPYCIQVHTDASGITGCTSPEGYNPPGCAGDIYSTSFPDLRYQTCHVWLSNSFATIDLNMFFTIDSGVFQSVYGHEVGHCVLRSGWHNPNPKGIMHNPVDSGDPVMRPLRSELDMVSALSWTP